MSVVAIGDQRRVEMWNALGKDWHFDQQRHVEVFQQRVNHESGATADDEESSVAKPAQGCGVRGRKSIRGKGLRLGRSGLVLLRRWRRPDEESQRGLPTSWM